MTKKNSTINNTKKKTTTVATTSAKDRTTTPKATLVIGRDEIAMRAYAIYLSGQGGTELDHWLQAERELTSPQNARI